MAAIIVHGRGARAQPAHWSGVFAMSLCVFALIASEFMPVILLFAAPLAFLTSRSQARQGA